MGREDARLGSGVTLQRVMPVEVIIGNVQHDGCVTRQRARGRQLKARELEHPDLGQIAFGQPGAQRVEGDGADVAGDLHPLVRCFNHQAHELAGRGLSIRAGHADDLRCVTGVRLQARELACEQLDLTDHFDLALAGRFDNGCRCRKRRRQSGA